MSPTIDRELNGPALDQFGAEIDALRARTLADIGERDARYIRNMIKAVRYTEVAGRLLLMGGLVLPAEWLLACWVLGVALLTASKIMDNMEVGHNIMHGQYDWMGEPHLNGKSFEWDIVGTSDNWRKTHNFRHHTYTNIHGVDDDIGYGVLRIFPEQKWSPARLFQPLYAIIFAVLFQWGVAVQDLRIGRYFKGRITAKQLYKQSRPTLRKSARQLLKDYVVFPLLAGPAWLSVMSGNATANVLRSMWTYMIIFCGHFTADVKTFPKSVLKNDTRAHWYLRQVRGSSNIKGGAFFNMMSGNLSFQIEHHLFPDVPANRYAEMAPVIQDICHRYGQHYNTGSLYRQFGQVLWRIVRHSFPSQPTPTRKHSAMATD